MAINLAPTALFPSYESDGTTISIDIDDLYGLTAAEAHATTGDWREIALSFCATYYIFQKGLTGDLPVAATYSIPTMAAITSGALSGNYRQTFTNTFVIPFGSGTVVDEPV